MSLEDHNITFTPVRSCKICTHIAVDKINHMMIESARTIPASTVRAWLAENYPTEPIPSIPAIINHRKKHLIGVLPSMSLGTVKMDRRTGKLIDQRGKQIEAVGIVAALKTVISIGVANMMADPSTVTPANTIEALKLLKQMNIQDDDPDADIWADAIVNPDALPKRGRGRPRKTVDELLDEHTEIIDVTDDSEETSEDIDEFPDPVMYDESTHEHASPSVD